LLETLPKEFKAFLSSSEEIVERLSVFDHSEITDA